MEQILFYCKPFRMKLTALSAYYWFCVFALILATVVGIFKNEAELIAEKKSSSKTFSCQVRDHWINFTDLGFHSILLPNTYNSGRCDGQCVYPFNDQENLTNYTILFSLNQIATGMGPGPCCVPHDFTHLDIFKLDEFGYLRQYRMEKMIVTSCICV